MVRYFRSGPGRLLAFAMALPLVGGAMVPWKLDSVGLFTLPLAIGIAIAIIAVGLSVEEHIKAAVTAVLALPIVLFLYVLFAGILVPQMAGLVYLLGAAGLGLLAVALRPSFAAPAPVRTAHPGST